MSPKNLMADRVVFTLVQANEVTEFCEESRWEVKHSGGEVSIPIDILRKAVVVSYEKHHVLTWITEAGLYSVIVEEDPIFLMIGVEGVLAALADEPHRSEEKTK